MTLEQIRHDDLLKYREYLVGNARRLPRKDLASDTFKESLLNYAPQSANSYAILAKKYFDEEGYPIDTFTRLRIQSIMGDESPPFPCDVIVQYLNLPDR